MTQTMTKTIESAPFVDTFSAEFQADPGAAVDGLRSSSWLVRTPLAAMVISRPHVQHLLGDRRLRSAVPDLARLQGVEGPLLERMSGSIIALEGDDHTRVRKLVNRAFTPRAVDVHRDQMRAVLERLVEPVAATGSCDFVDAIADHYPIQVMCHLLGVAEDDHEDFAAWNRAITWMLSLELGGHMDDVVWGMSKMDEYVSNLMADRRRTPRDDMVSALVSAREADDRLSDDEVQTMIAALLFAGYDTTRNQLGLAVWLFTQYPEQWRLLVEQADLAARAVEEVMRFQGAVAGVPRVVVESFDYEGYHLPAGTIVMLSAKAANTDPDAYVEPWTFDITVEREPHMTFGGGPHYCLGASLARAEMQEALPILAAAMPDLELDGEPTWRSPLGIFGPESLPIRFTPSAA